MGGDVFSRHAFGDSGGEQIRVIETKSKLTITSQVRPAPHFDHAPAVSFDARLAATVKPHILRE
jgi:hypothetical protein